MSQSTVVPWDKIVPAYHQIFSSSFEPVSILGETYDKKTTIRLLLSNKGLTSIPAEIGNLTFLQTLDLSYNSLTSIPAEIGNLINLKYIYLDNNSLTSIPAEIGNLTSLQELDLRNNSLTSIPAEIGNLTSLNSLILYDNKLTSIPKEILKIKDKLIIDETGYNIDNLDLDTEILIFSELKSALTNLPVSLKEIYLKEDIKDYNIKLPFGCKIKFF